MLRGLILASQQGIDDRTYRPWFGRRLKELGDRSAFGQIT
jgi:hypothetical protein